MRTVIVSNIMSVDGFYEGPGRNMMVLNMDAAFNDYNLERIRAASAVLLGSASFAMFSSYWPGIADAPVDPTNPAVDDVNREFSRIYNGLPKLVVSDSYSVPSDNAWVDTTTVVPLQRISDELADTDGEVLVFGSRTMWNGLLARDLVDEVHLMVSPTAVGGGTPTFGEPARLRLLGARTFEGSDNVLLRYAPRAPRIG